MLTLLSARLQCDLGVLGAFGPKLAELSAGDDSCAERLDTLSRSSKRSKGTRPRPRGDALDALPSAAGESAEMAWRWVAYASDRVRRGGSYAACARPLMTRGGGSGAPGLLSMLSDDGDAARSACNCRWQRFSAPAAPAAGRSVVIRNITVV